VVTGDSPLTVDKVVWPGRVVAGVSPLTVEAVV